MILKHLKRSPLLLLLAVAGLTACGGSAGQQEGFSADQGVFGNSNGNGFSPVIPTDVVFDQGGIGGHVSFAYVEHPQGAGFSERLNCPGETLLQLPTIPHHLEVSEAKEESFYTRTEIVNQTFADWQAIEGGEPERNRLEGLMLNTCQEDPQSPRTSGICSLCMIHPGNAIFSSGSIYSVICVPGDFVACSGNVI